MKKISTQAHGVLDYVSVVALAALPQMVPASTVTRLIAQGAAAKVLGSSLLTNYELGVMRVLPMRAHLSLDLLLGTVLLGYALTVKQESAPARIALSLLGGTAIGASLLTQVDELRSKSPEQSPLENGSLSDQAIK